MAGGVGLLFGPMLIGVFLNCILYGTMVVQTLMYFQTYKGDPRWFKIFVSYLLIFETLNTICDILMMYEPLIIRYGTQRAVTVAPVLLSADPVLTVMISLPVQLFIAWRVRIMSRSMIVPTFITLFAIIGFLGGIATAVAVSIINEYDQFSKFHPAPIAWLAASSAADIIITVSLVYNLSSQRTGYAATDHLINKIIRMAVQTGLVTAVSASLDILLFLVFKNSTLNFIWDLPLSKLYSNSLLSTLNARGGWKATSSVRDNVLFQTEMEVESRAMTRSRTQIEIVTVDRVGRPSSVVPMKIIDGSRDDPEIHDTPKFRDVSSRERLNY